MFIRLKKGSYLNSEFIVSMKVVRDAGNYTILIETYAGTNRIIHYKHTP